MGKTVKKKMWNRGWSLFQKEDDNKIVKIKCVTSNSSSQQPLHQKYTGCVYRENFNFWKPWPTDPQRPVCSTQKYIGKILFLRTIMLQFVRLLCKHLQTAYLLSYSNPDLQANNGALTRVKRPPDK